LESFSTGIPRNHKNLLTAIVFAVGALGYAAQADADLISIGLQETGVNGGAITTETTSSAAATLGAISYGTFRLNQATAQDTAGIGLPALLNSNSLNTSTESAGVLHVWVTAQGLTGLVGLASFVSTFAVNALSSDMSVVEQTFYDAGNGVYATTTPLSSAPFTTIGTSSPAGVPETPAGPFSVTEEYTITASGAGNANLTIDLSAAVPEPAALTLLASALLGFGWLARRRNTNT
jgi:PEP-CTERM motif